METQYEYPMYGPDEEEPTTPDLELPRCRVCGHEIDTVPVIRLFSDDPDAMWSICESCVSRQSIGDTHETD